MSGAGSAEPAERMVTARTRDLDVYNAPTMDSTVWSLVAAIEIMS
jgi:hypothetical protein